MDGHDRARSDWAILATDGTTKRSIVSSEGPMASSEHGVMPGTNVRAKGYRLVTRADMCGQELA